MRLHLLGLPHTVTNDSFSHCAFTQKVKRFAPMLRAQGYEVIHYGNAGATSGANEDVIILEADEHLELLGQTRLHEDPSRFVGDATANAPLFAQFNYQLKQELERRLEPGDVICLTFGGAHDAGTAALPQVRSGAVARVEVGIGYPDPVTFNRVYESEAWRHWTLGKESRSGYGWNTPRFEWVIPNYYDIEDWPYSERPEPNRVLFFGRITEAKGCEIVPVLARAHPSLEFVLCGQGDPAPYLTEPNIVYHAPLAGRDRAAMLGSAAAVICPSRFVEPFCGGAVEAMLCGTPVLTSDFGAFTETNIPGVTGYRCGTERSWIEALDRVRALDRRFVCDSARQRFLTSRVGPKYRQVFEDMAVALAARPVREVGNA